MLFLCYPKCSTCAAARNFLTERGIDFTERDIKADRPNELELAEWQTKSGLPISRFFNTSGLKYRELELSKKLRDMPALEQLQLLAADGMLVKRPIIVNGDTVLVGFKPKEWEKALK